VELLRIVVKPICPDYPPDDLLVIAKRAVERAAPLQLTKKINESFAVIVLGIDHITGEKMRSGSNFPYFSIDNHINMI